jgi:hypothetical protein
VAASAAHPVQQAPARCAVKHDTSSLSEAGTLPTRNLSPTRQAHEADETARALLGHRTARLTADAHLVAELALAHVVEASALPIRASPMPCAGSASGAGSHPVRVPRVEQLVTVHRLPAWRSLVARGFESAPMLSTPRLALEAERLALSPGRGRHLHLVDPIAPGRMLDNALANTPSVSRYLASYVLFIK